MCLLVYYGTFFTTPDRLLFPEFPVAVGFLFDDIGGFQLIKGGLEGGGNVGAHARIAHQLGCLLDRVRLVQADLLPQDIGDGVDRLAARDVLGVALAFSLFQRIVSPSCTVSTSSKRRYASERSSCVFAVNRVME